MLPPVDPAVLEANPAFAAVYQDLLANRLNPADGSTINPDLDARWAAAWHKINQSRTLAARHHLLRNSLLTLALRTPTAESGLSEELQTAISILFTPLADPAVRAEAADLLQDDCDYYLQSLPTVASAMAGYLDRTTPHIAALLHQASPSDLGIAMPEPVRSGSQSSQHSLAVVSGSVSRSGSSERLIGTATSPAAVVRPGLVANLLANPPPHFQSLSTPFPTRHIAGSDAVLPTGPLQAHSVHTQVLAEAVRILEQSVHGTVASHDRVRAEYLALQAREMELRSRIRVQGWNEAETTVQKAARGHLDRLRSGQVETDEPEVAFPFTPSKNRSTRPGRLTSLGRDLAEYIHRLESDIHELEQGNQGQ